MGEKMSFVGKLTAGLLAGLIGIFTVAAGGHASGVSSDSPAEKQVKPFPLPGPGMERYVLFLPVREDESLRMVQLIVGRTEETDPINRYFLSGRIQTETIQGWGFIRYVIKDLGSMAGSRMAVPPGTPMQARFIPLGGEPYLIRYNSRLPVVVYAPEGAEVRYRVWISNDHAEIIPPESHRQAPDRRLHGSKK